MENAFLTDDDATLQAALSFLDDCDEPLIADQCSSNSMDLTLDGLSVFLDHMDVPVVPKEPRKVVVVSTSSRRRRVTPKQEICKLRNQEQELAVRLESLRLQTYEQTQKTETSSKQLKTLPFWKKMSSRQYQRRADSERENRRLRSLVAFHVGRAKRLQAAWTRQMAAEGIVDKKNLPADSFDELDPPGQSEVFNKLSEKVEFIYANADEFLEGHQQLEQNQAALLEHSDSSMLPFERETVERGMLKALTTRFMAHKKRVEVSGDTITSCMVRTMRLPDMEIHLRVRWVAKKFREENRTLIILRALVEPQHTEIPKGVCFEETQVSVISNCPTFVNDGDPDATTATLKTFVRVNGNGPEGGSGDGMRWWATSRGGVATRELWLQAIQMRKNAVEDWVFEESQA